MYTVVQYDIRLMDGEIRAQATSNLSLLITKKLVSRRLERAKMTVGGRCIASESSSYCRPTGSRLSLPP